LSIILAIFFKANESNLAVYERGSFLQKLGGAEFMRLMKAPETFALQWCELAGDRVEVLEELRKALGLQRRPGRSLEVLDIVTPLCVRAAQLTEYSRRTDAVSALAQQVRRALLDATDPGVLIFDQLPSACGIPPFTARAAKSDRGRVRAYVLTLTRTLGELEESLVALRVRLRDALFTALDLQGGPTARQRASARATSLLETVRDPQVRAFCLRLSDDALAEDEWIDSVASFVLSKPPARWTSADEQSYSETVMRLARTLRRVEAIVFAPDARSSDTDAYHLVLTRPDGTELDRVIRLHPSDEARLAALERQILALLPDPAVAGAVISRLAWRTLSDS